MTLQQLIEGVEQVFPTVRRQQIIKEFDIAQKQLCSEAEILEESGSLSDVDTYISWNLPSGFVTLKQVDLYDSSGDPIYIENQDLDFEVYDGKIHFFSKTSTPLDNIPSTITYIVLRYSKMPSDLDTVDSTVDIDEVEYPAMEALVMKRLYSKIRVPKFVDKEGNVISTIDTSALKYWDAEYHRLKVEAKRRQNLLDDTVRTSTFYPHTGQVYFVRRTKEASITTITIPSYSSLYTNYVRFTATSPGTFTENYRHGYSDLSYAMDGDDIVITSSGEFTTSTWADDNQNSAHAYVSANEFRFTPYPAGAWGVTQCEIWEY